MHTRLLFTTGLSLNIAIAQQVGIGTASPHPSAKLEVSSSKQGVLVPRLGLSSLTSSSPIVSPPATGLLLFNDGSGGVLPRGFYWWDGSKWKNLLDSISTVGPLIGDGTISNPLGLQPGSTIGDLLVWNGTAWQIQQPGPVSGVASLCNSVATNYIQKWTGADLCNSIIYDDGTKVGIGTTSPAATLHIVSGGIAGIYATTAISSIDILQLRHTTLWWRFHVDASGHAEIGIYDGSSSSTQWNVIDMDPVTGNIGIGINASTSYRLYVNGRIKTTGINETSDRRLKEDIIPLTGGGCLQAVLNLKPVKYKWKNSNSNHYQIGLVAQEVASVIPEIIDQDEQGYYSVEYSRIAVLTAGAIQQLAKQIEELKQEVVRLQKENSDLRKQLNLLELNVSSDNAK